MRRTCGRKNVLLVPDAEYANACGYAELAAVLEEVKVSIWKTGDVEQALFDSASLDSDGMVKGNQSSLDESR